MKIVDFELSSCVRLLNDIFRTMMHDRLSFLSTHYRLLSNLPHPSMFQYNWDLIGGETVGEPGRLTDNHTE